MGNIQVFCLACKKEIYSEADGSFIEVTAVFPNSSEEFTCKSFVCNECKEEYQKTPEVVEQLINTRLIRLNYPEKSYKPENGN